MAKVLLQDEVILPPHSLIEVMARIDAPIVDCGCVLLVEDLASSSNKFVAANAVATPQQHNDVATVPAQLLNISTDSVTLHKGMVMACASMPEPLTTCVVAAGATEAVKDPDLHIPHAHKEILWEMVESSGNSLNLQ